MGLFSGFAVGFPQGRRGMHGVNASFTRSDSFQDRDVVEMEMMSVLEHWLRKVRTRARA